MLALHHPPSHRGWVEHLLLVATLLPGLGRRLKEGRPPPRDAVLAAQLAHRCSRWHRRRRARQLERLLPERLLLLRLVRVRVRGRVRIKVRVRIRVRVRVMG